MNIRSTGKAYLSKHKGYKHSESCVYYTDEEKSVRSFTEYKVINGGISDDGILRRKNEGLKSLEEYLYPTEKEKSTPRKRKTPIMTRNKASGERKQGIKINYDPNEQLILDDFEEGTKFKEPYFQERMPHQISEKDSQKNLRTSILIEKIVLNPRKKYGEIRGSFENVYVTLILPEAFFSESTSRINASELFDQLTILKRYIEKNPNRLYLITLCQSQKIELDKIQLYIWRSNFLSFLTKNRQKFRDLRELTLSIVTRHI